MYYHALPCTTMHYHVLASSFPGLHAQILPLAVRKVTKAGRGGLETRLPCTTMHYHYYHALPYNQCRLYAIPILWCNGWCNAKYDTWRTNHKSGWHLWDDTPNHGVQGTCELQSPLKELSRQILKTMNVARSCGVFRNKNALWIKHICICEVWISSRKGGWTLDWLYQPLQSPV